VRFRLLLDVRNLLAGDPFDDVTENEAVGQLRLQILDPGAAA
jgi:hypothetical protein